jgi:hypothetical protein
MVNHPISKKRWTEWVQTRTTSYDGPNLGLILHPEDRDNDPFVLVQLHLPEALVIGWIMGRDGKRARYWTELQPGRPCFFVPARELRPASDLKAALERAERSGLVRSSDTSV